MDHYASEQEQIDQIKRWWNENGRSLVFGLVIGIGGLAGYRYWDSTQTQLAENASLNYDIFLQLTQQQRTEEAIETGQAIVKNYPATSYSRLTGLLLAKLALDQGKPDDAKALLQALSDEKGDSQIRYIAKARLARLLLAEGNNAQAAKLLSEIPDVDDDQRFAELRGDALLASGDSVGAKSMYLKALEQAEDLGLERGAIQLKLDNLGDSQAETGS